jgi:hypothetical protein
VLAFDSISEVLAFDSISGSANEGPALESDSIRGSASVTPADLLNDVIELIAQLKRFQAYERRTLAA